MNNGQESRRSFRVMESLYIVYESISEPDFDQGLEHWKIARGNNVGVRSKLIQIDAKLDEKLFVLRSESVPLAEYLHLLNQKISTLVDELPTLKAGKSTLAKNSPQKCEIGADGMLFGSDQIFSIDSKLVLRFMFSADKHYVETFCRVVRIGDPPKDDHQEFTHGIAVEFLGMNSELQDVLIQHLFDRESETLRMRRLKIDDEAMTSPD